MVSSILQSSYGSIYNPENIYVSSDGGGAGNNWAYGYAQAQRLEDNILDMIEREAEGADNFEVYLLHGGGPGSDERRASSFVTRSPAARDQGWVPSCWNDYRTASQRS